MNESDTRERMMRRALHDDDQGTIEETEPRPSTARVAAVCEDPTPNECPICNECGARLCQNHGNDAAGFHLWIASEARIVTDGTMQQTMERCSKCEKQRPVLSAPLAPAPMP